MKRTNTYYAYDQSDNNYKVLQETNNELLDTWLKPAATFDKFRHDRMYDCVLPILQSDPNSSWLTIGDGRFGTDAIALARRGANEVHATDISGTLLEIAHRRGLIDSWSVQNAEALNFDNDMFDYVFCKESFHHFPRPYVAINEMLRVCRKGIILIEPRDHIIDSSFNLLANLVTVLRNPSSQGYWFEEVGNFVYTVSERELEKAMLGVGFTNVAFKGINDVYETGVEFLDRDSRGKMRFKVFSLYFKLFLKDMLCYASITKSSLLVAALFKKAPSNGLVPLLQRSGFKIKKLPTNPFRLNVLL